MIEFFRRLWTFVRPYRARLVMGLVCGILLALANGMLLLVVKIGPELIFHGKYVLSTEEQIEKTPKFFRPLVEWLASHLPTSIQASSNGVLFIVILSIPVIMFLRSMFSYLNVYLVNWASTRAMADLRTAVFAHLQNLPLSFFSQANTGDLISRVSSDTQSLRGIVGSSIATLVSDPFTILMVAAMLLSMQPMLTLFSIVVLPICIIPISVYARKVRQSARAMQTHTADLSKLMHEAFTGNRIIKAYNLEDKVLAEFREVTRKFVGQNMRVVRANEIPGNVTEFLGGVGVTLILLYIASSNAKTANDIGHFSAFLFGMFSMYKPIKNLTKLHNQFHQAHAASQRVFELLDAPSSMPEPASPKPLAAVKADIQFDDVCFSYGEKPVLRGINLTIKAGQFVALVGTTGSGKTSLVNLLPRFYDVESGAVLIGGLDVREVSLKDLRKQIAIVTQEIILFHDTFRKNIAAGRPDASNQEIEAAARHANAHEFITQKEGGYDAIVGEKGVTLSGGQKQRVSIARALVKDAPILILDEATSSLDSEVERAVQEELEKLMEGRTTICIAHRLSTVQKADRIVVLSEGQIVESGTHTELLQRGGVYQRLYELQFQSQK
jgi:subfamily B ATP-binding cassette protein MsbA